jgi:hypothetical protein
MTVNHTAQGRSAKLEEMETALVEPVVSAVQALDVSYDSFSLIKRLSEVI